MVIPVKKAIKTTPAAFNRVPGLNLVSNKVYIGEIFKRLSKHYEFDFNFIPKTFIVPDDITAL